MNFLYSSDMKDIKDVSSIYYKIEENEIIFTAKLIMIYDIDYHEYRIGRYNIKDGYGNIMTKKERKNIRT